MTYPQGLPTSQQPTDIHDATWGVLSAVYGGAVHPSAEGHAAMADAALPAAAAVLQLDAAVPDVISQPVAPVPATPGALEPPPNQNIENNPMHSSRRSLGMEALRAIPKNNLTRRANQGHDSDHPAICKSAHRPARQRAVRRDCRQKPFPSLKLHRRAEANDRLRVA